MLLSTVLSLFLAFWSLLYLLDLYLKSKGQQSYVQFVERTGLVFSPLQIRWYTHRLQSVLLSCSCWQQPRVRTVLNVWYSCGVVTALAAMFVMLIFLTRLIYTDIWNVLRLLINSCRHLLIAIGLISSEVTVQTDVTTTHVGSPVDSSSAGSGLIPVVPGVNVPWSHVPLFVLSLIVAGVCHELGHACAAINEKVNVNGFGVFLFALYPGAFTELENDALDSKPAFRRLRIYCAGIWHNLVLAAGTAAFVLLFPYLVSSLYLINKGVLVTDVDRTSGLNGAAGLHPNDVVFGINYCSVYNSDSWHGCLHRLLRTNYGYCVPKSDVLSSRTDHVTQMGRELECCGANRTQTHLCFYYKSLSNDSMTTTTLNGMDHSCLPARYVTDHYVCNQSLPCSTQRTTCVYPGLFNNTKLLRFFVANRTRPVLFIGDPRDVYSEVHISDFVSRIPTYLGATLPDAVVLFAKYLVTFSLALGLLNAVPCYGLDGQFMVGVLLELLNIREYKLMKRRRLNIYSLVMAYGTFLLVANVLVSLYRFALQRL